MSLPNDLALTTIGEGSQRLSAPVRNNFAAIQTAFNSLVDQLAGSAPAIGPLVTYTPAWTCATGGGPVVNNGTISGSYVQIGKLCDLTILLTAGSTTTFGGGVFQFSTPVTVMGTCLGTAILYDSSANKIYLGTVRNNTSGTLAIDVDWGPTGGSQAADATHPFTFATSDTILVQIRLFST